MGEQVYLFSKLSILKGAQDFEYIIRTALESNISVQHSAYWWGAANIDNLSFGEEEFKTGYLVKFLQEDQQETISEDLKKIIIDVTARRIQRKARFFLHLKTGILFHSSSVSAKQFNEVFAQIINNAHGGVFVDTKVIPIPISTDMLQTIRDFESIERIDFVLRPANPHWRDIQNDIKERFDKFKADEFRESIRSRRGGLSLSDQDEITGKVKLTEGGNGLTRILGILNGQKQLRSSTMDQERDISQSNDKDTNGIIKDLWDSFKRICQEESNNIDSNESSNEK